MNFDKEKSLETIVFMMTVENVHGREMLDKLLEYNIPITSIIIEHKSKLAENTRNYLNTKIYEPKKFEDIIRNKKISVHYVENFNDNNSLELIEKIRPDYIVLGGSRIIKEPIIKKVKKGILNAHPAILPKYQGLDCVGWSILNNDPVGVTVHFIDSGIDSGPIILQGFVEYSDCKSLIEVRIKAMKKCAELMLKSLIGLKFETLQPIQQNSELSEDHRSMTDEEISLVERKIINQEE